MTSPILGERISAITLTQQRKQWLSVELNRKLVVPYEPRRVLRSAESNLLTVPPGKPGKYGSRSFVRASANLWNSLRGERAVWL